MPTGIHVDFLCTHRRDRQYQKSHPQKNICLNVYKKASIRSANYLFGKLFHPS